MTAAVGPTAYHIPLDRLHGSLDAFGLEAARPWMLRHVHRLGFSHLALGPAHQIEALLEDGRLERLAALAARHELGLLVEVKLATVPASDPDVADELGLILLLLDEPLLDWRPIHADAGGVTLEPRGPLVGLAFAASARLPEAIERHCRPSGLPGRPRALFFRFKRGTDLEATVPVLDGFPRKDRVAVAFESPAGMETFAEGVHGRPGRWRVLLERLVDAGIAGLICRRAPLLSPFVWEGLIGAARRHAGARPLTVIAETGGLPVETVIGLREAETVRDGGLVPAFDHVLAPRPWTEPATHAFLQEVVTALNAGARAGTMTQAGALPGDGLWLRKAPAADRLAARRAFHFRDVALACLTGSAVLVPMGLEVLEPLVPGSRRDAQAVAALIHARGQGDDPLAIGAGIQAMTWLRGALGIGRRLPRFPEFHLDPGGRLARLHLDYADLATGRTEAAALAVINLRPEEGPASLDRRFVQRWRAALGGQDVMILPTGDLDRRQRLIRDVLILHTPGEGAPLTGLELWEDDPPPPEPRRRGFGPAP